MNWQLKQNQRDIGRTLKNKGGEIQSIKDHQCRSIEEASRDEDIWNIPKLTAETTVALEKC